MQAAVHLMRRSQREGCEESIVSPCFRQQRTCHGESSAAVNCAARCRFLKRMTLGAVPIDLVQGLLRE